MPVFTVGAGFAEANSLKSHLSLPQEGHLIAGIWSIEKSS